MQSIIVLIALIASVYAYHDPDLNYHLSQVQNVQGCGDSGYSYPAPAVQLTTSGVQAKPAQLYTHSIASGYSGGYSNNVGYSQSVLFQPQAIKVQPTITYQAQIPTNTYSTQTEGHGYATSSGLSSASTQGTVTPLATYAQAPIIAKITAAPLQAKYSLSPPKTSYVPQNVVTQQSSYSSGSYAKASLNSFNTVHSSGPVVSQVYAAPSSGYATSPSLKQQTPQVFSSAYSEESSKSNQYNQQANSASAVSSYREPVVAHYAAPALHVSAPAVVQYAAPAVTQHSSPAAQYSSSVSHYSAPAVTHYSAPAAHYASVSHYSAPAVTHHAAPVITQHAAQVVTHHAAPVVTHHAAPAVTHHAAPVVTHHAAGAITHHAAPIITQHVAHVAAPAAVAVSPVAQVAHVAHVGHGSTASYGAKNVHTEFLENYDAHPRYAFEYSVNDPHTGDVKQQKEERDGEVVKGQYSLVEPDGSVRTVNYVADWETGFHADVHNSKDNHH